MYKELTGHDEKDRVKIRICNKRNTWTAQTCINKSKG